MQVQGVRADITNIRTSFRQAGAQGLQRISAEDHLATASAPRSTSSSIAVCPQDPLPAQGSGRASTRMDASDRESRRQLGGRGVVGPRRPWPKPGRTNGGPPPLAATALPLARAMRGRSVPRLVATEHGRR
jgi:hypothetical protein